MNLDKFKGKTLDGATLDELTAELTAHTESLESRTLAAEEKARKAAKESIDGRKGKDAIIAKALEKLGIDDPEELDNLPDAKGQADAIKQSQAKLSRMERDLNERTKALDELNSKYAAERRERAIAEHVGKHPFIDADDVRALIGSRVKQEGDDLLFTGPDGKLVPLADGVAWFAKTKTHLVRPSGDAGGGSGFKGQKQDPGAKTMTRSAFDALAPAQQAATIKAGTTLTD